MNVKIGQNSGFITGRLLISNGKATVILDKDQGLGESCHAIVDQILPGRAVASETWDDPANRPPDKSVSEQPNVVTAY